MTPAQGSENALPAGAVEFTYGPSRSLNYVAPFVFFFLAVFVGSIMLAVEADLKQALAVIGTLVTIGIVLVVWTGRSQPRENERLKLVLLSDRMMLPIYGRRPWKTMEIRFKDMRKLEMEFVQEAHPEILLPNEKREVGLHLILTYGNIYIPKEWMPNEAGYKLLKETLKMAVRQP